VQAEAKTQSDIAGALTSYDTFGFAEQATMRAAWNEGIADDLGSLDLEVEFLDAGEAFTEADEDGNAVTRVPSST
jgi:hypothetical protein